jgi:hypothetical protein
VITISHCRLVANVGDCDTHAQQKISYMNETKWYEIWPNPNMVEFKKSFKLYRQILLKFEQNLEEVSSIFHGQKSERYEVKC